MPTTEDMGNASEVAVECPRCETANARGRKFCAQCGASLWETCLKCGTLCSTSENFCGGCGGNLDEAAAESLERLDADLRKATELQAAGRYADANATLERIAKNDHPRLIERADRARRLAQQWTAQLQRAKAAAVDSLEKARRLVATADYEDAARRLAGVPVSLRGEEFAALLTEIDGRRRQITELEQRIQRAIREKRWMDMPPMLECLLAVKPDHAHAGKLGVSICRRMTEAAKSRLARHDYDGASRLLQSIAALEARLMKPENGEMQSTFRRHAAELAFLSMDAANAPVVDATLIAAVERLCRLSPDDANAAGRLRELQRRAAVAKKTRSIEPIAWANPPRETPLGVPVEWCAGWRRLLAAETLDRSEPRRNPGRFQTACGLALGALRRSVLAINLLTGERRGVADHIAGLVRSAPPTAAWGIDIGGGGLKAARLTWDAARNQGVVQSAVLLEYAKPLCQAMNDMEQMRLISEALEKFLGGRPLKNDALGIGLPGRMAICRPMELPPVAPRKARSLVEFETRLQIDMPLDQLFWDWGPLGDCAAPPSNGGKPPTRNGCHAVWVAMKRHPVDRYLEMFRRLKLRVDVLQPDFIALHNFLLHEYFGVENVPAQAVVAALDIGCDSTNIVISSPHSLWYRNCGVTGQSFTRTLVKEYNLTLAQAEKLKRSPESAEQFSNLDEALSPVFDDLLNEVRRSLATYAETQPDQTIRQVVGLGGGFMLHGLFRRLRSGR